MLQKTIRRLVREYYHEDISPIRNLISAAECDLYYGDASSDDYPGFVTACKQIHNALDSVRDVWVDEDTECVSDREPPPPDACIECGELGDDCTCEDGPVCEGGTWWHVPRHEVIVCLVDKELAQYVR